MAVITLGMNSYFAVRRWPQPEEWLRIIRQELDMTIAQIALDILDPRISEPARSMLVRRTREAAEKHGVYIHSLLTAGISGHMSLLMGPELGVRMDDLHWFEGAIEMAGELSAAAVGGIMGAMSMKDFFNESRKRYLLDFFKEALHHLGHLGRQKGLQYLILEPSPVRREPPAVIDDALRLYDYFNQDAPLPIRMLMDLGHACSVGASGTDLDPYIWIERIGKLCPVIHLQQTDGKGDRHWPFTPEYNRKGIIIAEKVLEAIEKAGMKEVCLIFEISQTFEEDEEQVLDDLKASVEYWRKALAQR